MEPGIHQAECQADRRLFIRKLLDSNPTGGNGPAVPFDDNHQGRSDSQKVLIMRQVPFRDRVLNGLIDLAAPVEIGGLVLSDAGRR